jgi:hypothetical protein
VAKISDAWHDRRLTTTLLPNRRVLCDIPESRCLATRKPIAASRSLQITAEIAAHFAFSKGKSPRHAPRPFEKVFNVPAQTLELTGAIPDINKKQHSFGEIPLLFKRKFPIDPIDFSHR